MNKLKIRLIWIILIWNIFIILIIINPGNIKLLSNVLKELRKIIKHNSNYIEDGDYLLIHKSLFNWGRKWKK